MPAATGLIAPDLAPVYPRAMPPSDPLLGYATAELAFDELLGRGGMGAVYRGRQLRLDRRVAIKVIKPDLAADQAYLERFSREARAMGRLVHAHVVSCHDFGTITGPDGGQLTVMILEFIDGDSLGSLQRKRQPGARALLGLYRQACEGLAAAHAIGIIHRDIKPDNIMVTADGVAKIADFGLARVEDSAQLTQTGALLGSPAYMSPEASRGDEPKPASDIYSLGCSLFQSLTGRPPFNASSTLQVLHQHLTAQPPRLSAVAPHLAHLDDLLARCLDKDPAKRPNAATLVRELGRLEAQTPADMPAGASAITAVNPTARTITTAPTAAAVGPRRRRWPWIAGAAGLVLLLLIAAGGHRKPVPPPAAPVEPVATAPVTAPDAAPVDSTAPPPPVVAAQPRIAVLAPGSGILGAELLPGRPEAPVGAPAPLAGTPHLVMSQLGRIRLRLPAGVTSLCLVLHPGNQGRDLRVTPGVEGTITLPAGAWTVFRLSLSGQPGEVAIEGGDQPFFCAAAGIGVGRRVDWADLGLRPNALVAPDAAALRAALERVGRAGSAPLPAFDRTRVLASPVVHALMGVRLREIWDGAFVEGAGERKRLLEKAVDFGPACQEAGRDGIRWCFLMLDVREPPEGKARAEAFAESVEATLKSNGMVLVPVVGTGPGVVRSRPQWAAWIAEVRQRCPGLPVLDLHAANEFCERNRIATDMTLSGDALTTALHELHDRVGAAVPRKPQP